MNEEQVRIIKSTCAYIANQMARFGGDEMAKALGDTAVASNNPLMVDLFQRYTFFAERYAYENEFFEIMDEGYTDDEAEVLYTLAGEMDNEG